MSVIHQFRPAVTKESDVLRGRASVLKAEQLSVSDCAHLAHLAHRRKSNLGVFTYLEDLSVSSFKQRSGFNSLAKDFSLVWMEQGNFIESIRGAPEVQFYSGQSRDFLISNQLLLEITASQADLEVIVAAIEDESALQEEVTERVIESFADIGYRLAELRPRQLSKSIVAFSKDGRVSWCDQDLAKLLVYELNILIVSAAKIFDRLFDEVRTFLQRGSLEGDWGVLALEGDSLIIKDRGAESEHGGEI